MSVLVLPIMIPVPMRLNALSVSVTNNLSVVRSLQGDASYTDGEHCIALLIPYQALIAMPTCLPLEFHKHRPRVHVKPRGWSKDRAPISLKNARGW
jgi:hypothetical protein